jgi:hypothetical protein
MTRGGRYNIFKKLNNPEVLEAAWATNLFVSEPRVGV